MQTSVRFKTELLDDLAPTWRVDALLLKQIGRALVDAGVADVTYDAAWETKPDIPSRRRLDYGSVAAVVNVGLYEPGLNDAGKADPASSDSAEREYSGCKTRFFLGWDDRDRSRPP